MQWIDVMSLDETPPNFAINLSKIKTANLTYAAKLPLCFCYNSGITFCRFFFYEEPFTLQNIFINNAVKDGLSLNCLVLIAVVPMKIAVLCMLFIITLGRSGFASEP